MLLSRISLRVLFPLILFGIMVIGQSISLWLSVRESEAILWDQVEEQAEHSITRLSHLAGRKPYKSLLTEELAILATDMEFSGAAVVDATQTVYASSRMAQVGESVQVLPFTTEQQYQAVLEKPGVRSHRDHARSQLLVSMRYTPIRLGPGIRDLEYGAIFLCYDLKRVLRSARQEALRNAGIDAFIGLAIAVILTLLLVRLISGPLHQLLKAQSELSQGDLSSRLAFNECREMSAVAQGFNDMVEQLSLAIRLSEEGEAHYRSLMDTAPDGIITANQKQMIIDFNTAAEYIFGYRRDEVLGQPLHILLPEEYRDMHPEQLRTFEKEADNSRRMSQGRRVHGQRKDGSVVSLEIGIAKVVGAESVLFTAVVRDATENIKFEQDLLEAKNEAEAATEAKSNFLANMSHEIRTPMNGVLGLTSLLLDSSLDEKQRTHLQTIYNSGESLLSILNDILDFSKIEAGKMDLEEHDFHVGVVCNDIVSILQSKAADKGLSLQEELDESVPKRVRGDSGRLRQILMNLVGNAIKFTEAGSVRIVVRKEQDTDTSGDLLRFSVQDTGIGIPKDRLNKLFRAFSQVDASHARKFGGTGLGLTISKRLSELMGGTIGVTSTEGEGTEFWFTIRIGVAEEDESDVSIDDGVIEFTEQEQEHTHILLAEDNRVNQMVALGFLRKMGLKADAVANGQEALDALKTIPYDLVLMDMQMPEMDGLTASELIRSEHSNVLDHNLPIIAMTANALDVDRERCMEAGMNDFMSKPVDINTLRKKIARWLR